MSDLIRVSRSAVEERWKCPHSRYLGFHKDTTGLVKKNAKYDAAFGQHIHTMMASGGYTQYLPLGNTLSDTFKNILPAEEYHHTYDEQQTLLGFLYKGWEECHRAKLESEYEIVSSEVEKTVILDSSKYLPSTLADMVRPVEIPIRFDNLLRRKSDGLLFVLDFKTVSQASEDWNIMLDNSLQSHIYVHAAELLYGEPVGGIFYHGLVKGKRERDKAKSSPFCGMMIQYGSPLYAWEKNGKRSADYSTGSRRVKLFNPPPCDTKTYNDIKQLYDIRKFFPTTLPWKPIDSGFIMGQIITNENKYANDLEMYNEIKDGDPTKIFYEQTLFEKNLNNCYKYGTRHPCQFVSICHAKLHSDELKQIYEPRVDHHVAIDS